MGTGSSARPRNPHAAAYHSQFQACYKKACKAGKTKTIKVLINHVHAASSRVPQTAPNVGLSLCGLDLAAEHDHAVEAVVAAAVENKRVTHLLLCGNGIRSPALCKEIGLVAQRPALASLHLSWNALGAAGGAALAAALEGDRTLKDLHVRGCELGDAGGALLCAALSAHPSLLALDLAVNGLSGAVCPAVLELLKSAEALSALCLAHNDVTAEDAVDIRNIIAERHVFSPSSVVATAEETANGKFVYATSVRYQVGFADMQGRRPSMEDCVLVYGNFCHQRNFDLFGVFDGHGSRLAAMMACRNLPAILRDQLEQASSDNLEEAFVQTFIQTNSVVVAANQFTGSTALVCFIVDNTLYTTNAGDTRAVLGRNGRAIRLSEDHKPTVPSERERIEALGGSIVRGRVQGQLAVSRAFGDGFLSPYVTAVPSVSKTELQDNDTILVMACDGVWDVLDDEEAVAIAETQASATAAAYAIRNYAYDLGSTDNISVVVVFLTTPPAQSSKREGKREGKS